MLFWGDLKCIGRSYVGLFEGSGLFIHAGVCEASNLAMNLDPFIMLIAVSI